MLFLLQHPPTIPSLYSSLSKFGSSNRIFSEIHRRHIPPLLAGGSSTSQHAKGPIGENLLRTNLEAVSGHEMVAVDFVLFSLGKGKVDR